jgi:hypothetical protein
MSTVLDFSKAKKPTLPIKFPDNSVIHVYTPSKSMLEQMLNIKDQLNGATQNDPDSINQLYDIAARLMSNNKTARQMSGEELGEMLDVGDIVTFFRVYTEFIAELSAAKN